MVTLVVKSKGEGVSDVLEISKALRIIKWTEYFSVFLHRTVGERKIPLFYVICESDTVPDVVPPMMIGKSYSEEQGYV